MNKILKVMLGLLMAISLVACSDISTYPIDKTHDQIQETEDTPLFEVPKSFKVIAFDEASSHYNDPKTVMVYSFDDCPHCAVVIPLLDEIYNNINDPDISMLYVDVTRSEREDGNKVYDDTIQYFKDYLGDEGKMYVPFTVFLNNGDIIATHIGDQGIDNMDIKDTLVSYFDLLINV